MKFPWSIPTGFDASKIGLAKSSPPPLTGERIYELLLQPSLTEDFVDLSAWTVVDSGGNISVAGGAVTINGNGVAGANTIVKTAALDVSAPCCLQFDYRWWNSNLNQISALYRTATPNFDSTNLNTGLRDISSTNMQCWGYGQQVVGCTPLALTDGQWYTVRLYLVNTSSGAFKGVVGTIEGGLQYPEETSLVCGSVLVGTSFGANGYPGFSRVVNNGAAPMSIRSMKFYRLYPVDGPPLTYVADASAGNLWNGWVFSSMAAVGGWATTNVKFKYSFDSGVAAYNASWLTPAELQARSALTTHRRYARLQIQMNSDGATQQRAGEMNADDATGGIIVAPVAPSWGPGEVSGIS